MPHAVAAFVVAFGVELVLVAGSTLASAFFAGAVVAALTHASSLIYRKLVGDVKRPELTLADRKETIQRPAPSRKILYGDLEIAGSIVDIRSTTHYRPLYGIRAEHLRLIKFANRRRASETSIASADNAYPVIEGSPPTGASLSTDVFGPTIYHEPRSDPATPQSGTNWKTLNMVLAMADNDIEFLNLYLGNSTVSGNKWQAHTRLGVQYVFEEDHDDETETVIEAAETAAHGLRDRGRYPGFSARLIYDATRSGNFLDICLPRGFNPTITSDPPSSGWMAPLGLANATPLANNDGTNKFGTGTAILACTFAHWAGDYQDVPWPSIPNVTARCRGRVADTTRAKASAIVNNNEIWREVEYNNAALCCYDYLLHYTDFGAEVLGEARINEASVRQAIIDCHNLGLTANAYIDLESRPDDVLAEFAKAMRMGDIYDVGGIVHMIVGKPVATSATITEDDILEDWSFVGGLPRDARPETVNVEFPTTNSIGDATITIPSDFIRGEGSGTSRELTVAFAGSQEQALDAAAITLLQAQESQGLELTLRAAKGFLLPNETVMVDMPALFGNTPKKFRILSATPNPDLSIRLEMREERDAVWGGYNLLFPTDRLLLEDSDFALLESGDKIVIVGEEPDGGS